MAAALGVLGAATAGFATSVGSGLSVGSTSAVPGPVAAVVVSAMGFGLWVEAMTIDIDFPSRRG